MPESLEANFQEAMIGIYRTATRELNYRPKVFLDMVTMHGGVAAARYLINAPGPSEGFTRLWEARRLDLSVEAVVTEHARFHALFTDQEVARARERLRQYEYGPTQ